MATDATLPLIVHIPHGAVDIPADVRRGILLGDDLLRRELIAMTDRYTAELAEKGCRMGHAVRHAVSRLVIDPERFRDDADESMSERGMGAVYTRTHDGGVLRELSAPERERLLRAYYDPHHDRFNRLAWRLVERDGRCLIADIHSFPSVPLPYEPDQIAGRPDICVGTDAFHTPADLVRVVEAYFNGLGLKTDRNRPFAGTFVPMDFYGKDVRAASIMIEINRSLYMDEKTGEKSASFAETKRVMDGVFDVFRGWLTGEGS